MVLTDIASLLVLIGVFKFLFDKKSMLLSGFTVDAQVRGQFKVTSLFCMRTQELESRCSTHPSQELAIEYS
jgi:hypothetical protein